MAKVISIRGRVLQSRDAVDLISDKWRISILHVLDARPLRSGELQRAITEISSKVLTQTLRGMERDGLIAREVYTVYQPAARPVPLGQGTRRRTRSRPPRLRSAPTHPRYGSPDLDSRFAALIPKSITSQT